MLKRIRNILAAFTETDIAQITPETSLVTDLGFNSFEVVNIVSAFEEEFDIEIADRDIRTLATVGDIMAYIEERT